MTRLKQLFFTPLIPEPNEVVHRWANGLFVPLMWMAMGLPFVWRTATTPFEEFQGTLTVVGFSLLWNVWADVVRNRSQTSRVPQTDRVS